MKKLLTLLLAVLLILTACSKPVEKIEEPKKETTESNNETEQLKQVEKKAEQPAVEPNKEPAKEENQKTQKESTVKPENKEESFKENAEKNAKEHVAGPGKVLVTKGNFNFTGLPYYFKGELLEIGSAEVFDNKNIWLVKNDNGYVMPVEMYAGETANPGDIVEIWGTLSGEGYNLPNVDNIVGETGYLITVQYNLNGEIKY